MRPAAEIASSADALDRDYRPLSVTALVGFVLSLLSPAALTSPVFWILPLAGLAVCLLAIFQIRREESALAGRGLAMAGLCLNTLFLTAGPTHYGVLKWLIRREALATSDQWVEFVKSGLLTRAEQLMRPPSDRVSMGDAELVALYGNEEDMRADLEKLQQNRAVTRLVAAGASANATFTGRTQLEGPGFQDMLAPVYRVDYTNTHGEPASFEVQVLLDGHENHATGQMEWRVHDAALVGS
jgi:hypothetical protein